MLGALASLPVSAKPNSPVEVVASTVLAAAAASIVLTALPAYRMFIVQGYLVKSSGTVTMALRLNADSGTNYAFQQITANSTSVAGVRSTSQSAVLVTDSSGWDTSQGAQMQFRVVIAKSAGGGKAQVLGQSSYPAGTPGNTAGELNLVAGEWPNTSDLVTSISLTPSSGTLEAGTSVVVYGVRL